MATKNNRRTVITKNMLKKSLMELMQEKKFSGITIKELCERADLNRTTFYLHYSSLEELLGEIEQYVTEHTLECILNIQKSDNEIDQIVVFLNYLKDNDSLFRTLLCNNPNFMFRDSFLNKIMDSTRNNMIKYASSNETFYIQTFIMSGCHQTIIKWIEDNYSMPTDNMAELIYLMSTGVRSQFLK